MLAGDFYDEAIAAATRAIELDPDCAPAYVALGLAYDRRGGLWDQSIPVSHELAEVVPAPVSAPAQPGAALSLAALPSAALGDAFPRMLLVMPSAHTSPPPSAGPPDALSAVSTSHTRDAPGGLRPLPAGNGVVGCKPAPAPATPGIPPALIMALA